MRREEFCYPLTHPQQRILQMERFYQGTSIGSIAATIRVKEGIPHTLFEKAVNTILQRNDGLRLQLKEQDGKPVQVITPYTYTPVDYYDMSADPDALFQWDTAQAKAPFILEYAPLYYFALIKVSDQETCFFLKLHHLITDAWSMVMLGNQMLSYCQAYKSGMEIEAEYPSYAAYIESEQQYKQSQRFVQDQAYWHQKYETLPEPATLSRRDTGYKSAEAARKTFVLSEPLAQRIRGYAAEHKTSVFTLFLSALAVYIYRVTNNRDIVIGTPVLNRSNHKEKRTMGMFVSTVPLRLQVQDGLAYTEFIQRTGAAWLETLRHQRYPYDLLIKDLRRKHKHMDNLYHILLSYQNGRFNKDGDTQFEGRWHSNGCQADPLFIHINDRESDGRFVLDYDYMTQFYDLEDILHIHQCLMNLLLDAMNHPNKSIDRLDLMDAEEKRYILEVLNHTKQYCPLERGFLQRFAKQAADRPDAPALTFEGRTLTYRQLDEQSNALAHRLCGMGLKPNEPVGIYTARSLEMITAILAVLKAGGCFMPMDPDYPMERLRIMLQNSGTQILLTRRALITEDIWAGKWMIFLEDPSVYSGNVYPLAEFPGPKDLAYVIYTSGSTGQPKGVMIDHQALNNYIDAIGSCLDYTPGGAVLSVTTMAFDIFVFEIFPSLSFGQRIVLANEQQQKIPEMLSALILEEGVEKMLTTPSRMQLLLSAQSDRRCFDVLKEIALGGEAFPKKLLQDLQQATAARLLNLYGPTEATVYCTIKDLTHCDGAVSIGGPLNNYRIYLLDKCLNLVPIGVAGEICISGDSLAQGYMHQPELTQERFVPNPYEPGQVMYKTGDYGRLTITGDIEFIGRMDYQVKIRGYRVELGEIEHALLQNEAVMGAVVIDREDVSGKKYLCGYVTSRSPLDIKALKSSLSRQLPEYMVPARFVRLEQIPLTPNGKIDRRALPEPDSLMGGGERSVTEPRNKTDSSLISIWRKVLQIDSVGIDDDFFDLGGDSLTIIEVQVEMLPHGWRLNTQAFYECTTIRQLSDWICGLSRQQEARETQLQAAVSIAPALDTRPVARYKRGFKYRTILLTGATGFFGIHLLKDLLTHTQAQVICLVRGASASEALSRLMAYYRYYFPKEADRLPEDKLTVLSGDLGHEDLGLAPEQYDALGRGTELVIHSAAVVKYFGDYREHYRINVEGSERCAQLCMTYHIPLAYMSTLGVSGNYLVGQSAGNPVFTEKDFYIGQRYMDNVYVRSKFEAENLLYQKMAEGLSVNIFRLGNLTGRYEDGHFQRNTGENAFYSTLRSLIGLGAVNQEILDQEIEFTPVDACSRAVLALINVQQFSRRVYHVFNHHMITLREVLEVFRAQGLQVNILEKEAFSEYMDQVLQDTQKKKYLMAIINDLNQNKYLDFGSFVNIDSTTTLRSLRLLGFKWPKTDAAYLRRILDHMQRQGFLASEGDRCCR